VATKTPIIDPGPIDIDLEPHDPFPEQQTDTLPPNVLNQIADAMEAYPATFVELEFVDVEPASGTVLNTNEEAEFRLRVFNRGPLTMRDVVIKIVGKNGAKVKDNGVIAQFETETLVSTIDSVAGHNDENPQETLLLHLKAPPREKADGTDLVEAYVDSWNGDWLHTLNSHSRAATAPNGVYESAVEKLND
jgi:hypothetical protein